MNDDATKLHIAEDKILQISYGMLMAFVASMSTMFIWVGYIQYSMANSEKTNESDFIKMTEIEKTMHSIDLKLAKIEGILEELRKK